MEHGAYLKLLHAYYGTEQPLPQGEDIYRVAGAHTKAERAAVDKVLGKFWRKTSSGYVNGRAFDEIETASELAKVARQNGTRGGRPKKPAGLFPANPTGSNN
jgi:uncharacterized protein YdaU (DUF1376 family)